jgi:hypothetical protein
MSRLSLRITQPPIQWATAKLHLASGLELTAAVSLLRPYFFAAWNEANLHTLFHNESSTLWRMQL